MHRRAGSKGKVNKYPRNRKRVSTDSLNALKTISILGGRFENLSISTSPNNKRQDRAKNIFNSQFWNGLVPNIFRVSGINNEIDRECTIHSRNINRYKEEKLDTHALTYLRNIPILNFDDENVSLNENNNLDNKQTFESSSENISVMDSTNDSIIWNNRSSNQVNQLESRLSLVANPPSTISQNDESVLSYDSQFTRSSGIDVSDLVIEDERRWLKYRVENLTRDECIIICVLAQLILSDDELPGTRDLVPTDEEAKQTLLFLCYGGCWELNNLKTVLDLAEFLPVGMRRLCGLGVRDKGQSARKILEGRLEQCLDLSRRLNWQQTL